MIVPKKIKVICSVLCFLVPIVLNILSNRLAGLTSENFVINLLMNMVNTGNNYFEHTTNAWALTIQNSGSAKLERVIYMMIAFVLFYLYICILRKEKVEKQYLIKTEINTYIDFPFLVCLMTFSCVTMVMPEYWRFVTIAILFGGGIIIMCYNLNKFFLLTRLLQLLTVLVFALWIRNLCLYSDVPTMLLRSLAANPMTILVLNAIGSSINIVKF